jgi:hypothetical protein
MRWAAILVAAILAGCGERGALEGWDEGEPWDQWARGVEARFAVGDAEGHGPDLGSDEWERVLQWKLGVVDEQGHGPDIGSAEWRAAVEQKIGAAAGN